MLVKTGKMGEALESYQQASSLGEQVLATDQKNESERAALAMIYSKLGRTSALVAESRRDSRDKRLEYLRAACSWYQKSLALWLDMKDRGALSSDNAGKPDEVAREIAKCEATLS